MFQSLYPDETEQALQARAAFPTPQPLAPSVWAQMGELGASPYKGAAQGLNQSLRVANRLVSMIPGGASEAIRQRNAEISADLDTRLGGNVEYWNPDPVTSTTASQVLHQGARFISKAAGYSAAGGLPGAVAGMTVDEGVTGYMELRDKGVDPSTAAKVAAVRGAAAGVSVALPVVGKTGVQTAGLVAVGGPGTFMAEQALSREILASAQYPHLAQQYDPTDPVGLTLSIAVPGTIGAAVHSVRARRPAAAALADSPEHLDAAHVVFQDEQVKAAALHDPANLPAMDTHRAQIRQAARALDEAEPVHVVTAPEIEPARLEAVVREARARVEDLRRELVGAVRELQQLQASREADAGRFQFEAPEASAPSVAGAVVGQSVEARPAQPDAQQAPRADEAAPVQGAALERAAEVAAKTPDLPVRLSEHESPMAARDAIESVRRDVELDRQESRAFMAAVECALRSGM